MANQWLRLWHDMPSDPKWKTISRVSNQQISLVIATYICIIVDASRNVTRGHVTVTTEDIASQLDVTEDQINSILSAMNGRVIDENGCLTGWEKRQPKREDSGNETGAKSAAERKREQRERERKERESNEQAPESIHVTKESRNVTLDKDKDKDKKQTHATPSGFAEFWLAYPKKVGKGAAEAAWKKHRPSMQACLDAIAVLARSDGWLKDGGQFIPNPATWINQRRWEDDPEPKQSVTGSIGGLPRHLMLADEVAP